MITVDEALALVLRHAAPLPRRPTELAEALGCRLAEDVAADLDLPPFDKSLVDGYAIRSADLGRGDRRFRIVEEITAGKVPRHTIGPGDAAMIMTGAPLPDGADAVVMHEKTRREGDLVEVLERDVPSGQNWIARAREMSRGDVVLRSGAVLSPVRLGLLASVGRSRAMVVPRPRVSVVATGDELVEPDQVPGPGQIRNSNAAMVSGLARAAGATVRTHPIARDEPAELRDRLGSALSDDMLLITGGVSVGTHDLVPAALEALGVERVFHKVRVKPGKPAWFGVRREVEGRPPALVFGLPGNPASGLVSFLLLVRPALEVLSGGTPVDRSFEARLARPFRQKGERQAYQPSLISTGPTGTLEVEPLDWAGSSDLRTVSLADALAVFPPGDRSYRAGEMVRVLPLG